MVLVTAVSEKTGREGIDFFPLTVDYIEMTYAAGKIPGGFFKREGRPTEREILTSRFIDRPVRPLFPKGFKCETQIIATVLSSDGENDSDILAINACAIDKFRRCRGPCGRRVPQLRPRRPQRRNRLLLGRQPIRPTRERHERNGNVQLLDGRRDELERRGEDHGRRRSFLRDDVERNVLLGK